MELIDIKGVGEKILVKLNKLNINSVDDLVNFLPKSYIDMSKLSNIEDICEGDTVLVKVEIFEIGEIRRTKNGTNFFKAKATSNKMNLEITWFSTPYVKAKLETGEWLVYGKLSFYNEKYCFTNPTVERADMANKLAGILAVYPLKGEIPQSTFLKIVNNALKYYDKNWLLKENFDYKNSLYFAHNPKSLKDMLRSHYALCLYDITIDFACYRKNRNITKSCKNLMVRYNIDDMLAGLPYALTESQNLCLEEILQDIFCDIAMNRLLLGDVGSGKTVVAMLAMYALFKAGGQSVLMAPTEILCIQHFNNAIKLFENHGINIKILTSSTPKSERIFILENLKNGSINFLFSTQSCLSEQVEFDDLQLVIIDELHKFGVKQKGVLEAKNANVNVLTMSATPVPRTLAMVLYGDLKVSKLQKREGSENNIKTYIINSEKLEGMYNYIKNKVLGGGQAYVVCPRLEDSDGEELYSAKHVYKMLKDKLSSCVVGLIYGDLKDTLKREVMKNFAEGKINVLVSTSVIEVGVDVKKANVILILGSNHFGLASLHQLRGRVGRGGNYSECFLHITKKEIPSRIKLLRDCNDGLKLAEHDALERGLGDVVGVRQSGKSAYDRYCIKVNMAMIRRAKGLADTLDLSSEEVENAIQQLSISFKNITLN